MKSCTLHISGMHCASCKILLEDILAEQPGVNKTTVNEKTETVLLETDGQKSPQELAQMLTNAVQQHGYALSEEKRTLEKKEDDTLWKALPLGIFFLVLFFILQKSGVLDLGIGGKTTPSTAFLIGLIASVSSCLAVVGGLVLSLSAEVSQEKGSPTKNIILFHGGRLFSFAFLGGVLGAMGKAVGINFSFTAILGLIASTVMIFLGLHLLGILKKNKITLPSGMFQFFKKVQHKTLTPLLLGFGTFFLPCGFTQSMQIAALGSGSFFAGFFIMLSFAIGTLPMLSLLSFGSASFAHSPYAPLFFKSAGVVVVGLGLFALLAGLSGLGILPPLFTL
ncbi:MAG: sulfite exporter TauE/SafE family protein [Candidatus Peregrinibacteria bacterium]